VSNSRNRQLWLRSRPTGIPQACDFALREVAVPTIADGAFLVRNQFLSADPAMRGWITDTNNYASRVEIGDTIPRSPRIPQRHSATRHLKDSTERDCIR